MKGGTKRLAIVICVLVLFFTFSANYILTIPKNSMAAPKSSSSELTLNERITEELYLENIEILTLGNVLFTIDSEVLFGVENLLQSNCSVYLYPHDKMYVQLDPAAINFTLVPGEGFEETYTIIESNYSTVTYFCNCSVYPSNATIKWWYEVIFDAGDPPGFGGLGIEYLFIGGSLFLTMIALVFISKKKSNKKD